MNEITALAKWTGYQGLEIQIKQGEIEIAKIFSPRISFTFKENIELIRLLDRHYNPISWKIDRGFGEYQIEILKKDPTLRGRIYSYFLTDSRINTLEVK